MESTVSYLVVRDSITTDAKCSYYDIHVTPKAYTRVICALALGLARRARHRKTHVIKDVFHSTRGPEEMRTKQIHDTRN